MTSNHLTILLVDDEEMLRQAIADVLKKQGYNVIEAGGGHEAFEKFKASTVDVVVTDVRMPGGDGIELIKNIKQREPGMPIVLFLSASQDLSTEEAHDIGVAAILAKPFPKNDLLEAVKRVLSGKLPAPDGAEVSDSEVIQGNLTEESLGQGGFVCKIESNLPSGQSVDFDMGLSFGENKIQLKGKGMIRWINPSHEGDFYLGVEFVHLNPESRVLLMAWLNVRKPTAFIPRAG